MQFSRNTSSGSRKTFLGLIIKTAIFLTIIISVVVMIGKIDFPSPNKEIEKIISNEKLKIVK